MGGEVSGGQGRRRWVLRRIGHGAAVAGLVAAAAVLIGWARSGGRWDDLSLNWGRATAEAGAPGMWEWRSRTLAVSQWSGVVQWRVDEYTSARNDEGSLRGWKDRSGWSFETMRVDSPKGTVPDHWDGPFAFRWGGFCCEKVSKQGLTARVVSAPHWFVAGVLAAPGLVLLAGWGRARRRGRLGRCGGCGYDLGSLERCPECGRTRGAAR
jgi:hypothetical protein